MNRLLLLLGASDLDASVFGMVLMRYLIYLILFRKYLNSLKIKRDKVDTTESGGLVNCRDIDAEESPTSGDCACTRRTPTFMSPNNSFAKCKHASDLKCRLSLIENSTDDFLIMRTSPITARTYPRLKPDCSRIKRVLVWNLLGNNGIWFDATEIGKEIFGMDSDSVISIKNVNMAAWAGHLVMIKFRCEPNCLFVKFKGTIDYPFHYPSFNLHVSINNNDNGDEVELSPETITIIIIATVFLVVILLSMCIFRRKLPCREETWPERTSSASSRNRISSSMQSSDMELTDPWYDVNRLSNTRRDLRRPSGISGDSFYIPTIKGFSKERHSRGGNISDVNYTQNPALRYAQSNPYQESASS